MSEAALAGDTIPAARRALFHHPVQAFKRPIPPVPVHAFADECARALAADAPTGLIALDLSATLDLPWPATTPTLLARYLVIRAGESFTHAFEASGAVCYVIRGEGETRCDGEQIGWRERDAMALPGGCESEHRATAHTVMLIVTDEPLAAYEQSHFAPEADVWRIRPTLYLREVVQEELAAMRAEDDLSQAAGKAIVLMTEAMQHRKCVTRNLSVGFNTLEPGDDQRPHAHSAAALTLGIEAEGVYSMVDGQQVDWAHGLLAVTPPGAVHSHHNRGPRTMFSFVVQDSPLHAQLRTSHFSYAD